MSTNCDHCGYRDNEVKSGGAIPAQGKKITLKVEDEDDLSRDLLKVSRVGYLPSPQSSNVFTTPKPRPVRPYSRKHVDWKSLRLISSFNLVP